MAAPKNATPTSRSMQAGIDVDDNRLALARARAAGQSDACFNKTGTERLPGRIANATTTVKVLIERVDNARSLLEQEFNRVLAPNEESAGVSGRPPIGDMPSCELNDLFFRLNDLSDAVTLLEEHVSRVVHL